MPYKPESSGAVGGGYRPGGAVAEEESPFWKALQLIGRPSSASFGAITALQEGDDPYARVMSAIKGEKTYSGADVLKNFGMDPESGWTKAGGFALDVLNPIDPLNYVGGLGGLTKAGRAAELIGKGAESWGVAAKLGERGLLNFAGHRVPLPGDSAVLDALQGVGKRFADSELGTSLNALFGGKRGAVMAAGARGGIDKNVLEQILSSEAASTRLGNKFSMDTAPELDALAALRGDDKGALLEHVGRMYRGDVSYDDAFAAYVKPGTAGSDTRQAAWDAVDTFMKKQKQFLSPLEETGMDAYARPAAGHFARIARVPAGGEMKSLGEKLFEERAAELQGPSANMINKMLLPGSIEPVAVETLSQAGKDAFAQLGGRDFFAKMEKEDPQVIAEFLRQHRMTPGELNASERVGFKYETDPAVVFKAMRDDAIKNVKADDMVRQLQKAGLVQPWDDAVHGVRGEDGRYLFAKVDQGRYANAPVAVPYEYARALQKMTDTLSPGPDKALMGAMLNDALPEMLKNAGLMQWWKALSIFGGGPSYFSRNFFTGVIKNYYEGLGLSNPQSFRFYPEAMDVVGRALRGKWDDGFITLSNGTKLSKQRLYQEYITRGMHGGGFPDVDIVEAGAGKSKALREKLFWAPRKINEQVEMAVRLPLALKQVEDTIKAMERAGISVPKVIGPLAESEHGIVAAADDVVERAFANADRQVKLSHFDYTDLSPFEENLRRHWIPFYTWMRKNIPSETMNMLQRPGKYMPFVRAYTQGLRDSGLTPEDMPEWMQQNFAVPAGETPDGRRQFVDLTGFLPFMDVVEMGNTLAGKPRTGEGRVSTIGRYVASRFNPFLQEAAEQSLQKEFLTGRQFSDLPTEMMGVTMSPTTAGAVGLVRPVRELDRLNPGGVFTKIGNALGTFEGDVRPHRNEPGEAERWLRFGLGLKAYGADPDEANKSKKERAKETHRLRKMAMSARREGRTGEAAYLERLADTAEGG